MCALYYICHRRTTRVLVRYVHPLTLDETIEEVIENFTLISSSYEIESEADNFRHHSRNETLNPDICKILEILPVDTRSMLKWPSLARKLGLTLS